MASAEGSADAPSLEDGTTAQAQTGDAAEAKAEAAEPVNTAQELSAGSKGLEVNADLTADDAEVTADTPTPVFGGDEKSPSNGAAETRSPGTSKSEVSDKVAGDVDPNALAKATELGEGTSRESKVAGDEHASISPAQVDDDGKSSNSTGGDVAAEDSGDGAAEEAAADDDDPAADDFVPSQTAVDPSTLADFLATYGYLLDGAGEWQPDSADSQPMLTIRVPGHTEQKGHTRYTLECELVPMQEEGATPLKWTASKRLNQLRNGLHDAVKNELGEEGYSFRFKSTPFARRAAPRGTTARLDAWCTSFTKCMEACVLPPGLVARTLLLLDLPCEDQVILAAGESEAK